MAVKCLFVWMIMMYYALTAYSSWFFSLLYKYRGYISSLANLWSHSWFFPDDTFLGVSWVQVSNCFWALAVPCQRHSRRRDEVTAYVSCEPALTYTVHPAPNIQLNIRTCICGRCNIGFKEKMGFGESRRVFS